jgi:hypothetical protein
MIKSNNIISRDMLDILRECKGRKVETLLRTDQDFETSFEVVILRFKEYDLEIWSLEQPVKEGGLSDLAKIIVKANTEKNSKSPIGRIDRKKVFHPKKFAEIPINQTISGITIHNELVQWTNEYGSFLLADTYAIVISFGTGYLHIVKGPYWSEIWEISFSQSPVPKAPEWDESEGDKYEITYSVIEL